MTAQLRLVPGQRAAFAQMGYSFGPEVSEGLPEPDIDNPKILDLVDPFRRAKLFMQAVGSDGWGVTLRDWAQFSTQAEAITEGDEPEARLQAFVARWRKS